jgi:hypothetical protein
VPKRMGQPMRERFDFSLNKMLRLEQSPRAKEEKREAFCKFGCEGVKGEEHASNKNHCRSCQRNSNEFKPIFFSKLANVTFDA